MHTSPRPLQKRGLGGVMFCWFLCRFQFKNRNSNLNLCDIASVLLYFDFVQSFLYGHPSQLSHLYGAFSETNPVFVFSCFVPIRHNPFVGLMVFCNYIIPQNETPGTTFLVCQASFSLLGLQQPHRF